LSTSEFNELKARLVAMSASTRAINAAADAKRPTLKRRPQTSGDTGGATSDDASDRPVLKRRDGSDTTDANSSDKQTESGDRPVLKRREGSSSEEAKPAEKPAEPSERPTLKRRSDTNSSTPDKP
jgi:hypothetical protein